MEKELLIKVFQSLINVSEDEKQNAELQHLISKLEREKECTIKLYPMKDSKYKFFSIYESKHE